STSMPRSANTSSARGLNASAIKTFGIDKPRLAPGQAIAGPREVAFSELRAGLGVPPRQIYLLLFECQISGAECRYAAFVVPRASSQAQSSQGSSASTSLRSTVAPVQMRKPGGEARWLARS